jgi:hypothetical protein
VITLTVAKTILLSLLIGVVISCGTPSVSRRLDVIALRYDTTNLTNCEGEVKNTSPHSISNLQVELEFLNAESNRVRAGTANISPSTLEASGVGSFSVPYSRGSNDPPVVRCRIVEFRSEGVELRFEDDSPYTLR